MCHSQDLEGKKDEVHGHINFRAGYIDGVAQWYHVVKDGVQRVGELKGSLEW